MTNMKKLGLTALAGSLVATSAMAGELAVTGTAKITYVSQHESEVTGNSFSMSQGIGFAGSGDLDNGMSIAYGYTMSDAAFSSSTLKLDMGDMGTLSYSDGAGTTGISAYDDKMPTAGEEVWDDLDGQANGVATITNKGTLGYAGSFGPVGVSASYNQDDGADGKATEGSSHSIVLSASPADGATVFYGQGEKSGTTEHNGTDLWTAGVTYAAGATTLGFQSSSIDSSTTNGDRDRTHIAISFAVNENMSLSYGMSNVDFEGGDTDQEDSGIAVSYTMGSMTLGAFQNKSDNVGGSSGTEDTVTEVSLAFAF
jgi:outer membrane protein OmpU